jgi:guanyl-specific ribonuclease Sa
VLLVAGLAVVVWHNRSVAPAAGAAGPTATRTVAAGSRPTGSAGVRATSSSPRTTARASSGAGVVVDPRAGDVRAKAEAVLAVLDRTGKAPQGYVGGRQFLNDGRGGTSPLPRTSAQGLSLRYTEYDVNPFRKGVNRGPQRLVVGSDGSAYVTADHYLTWFRLR